MGFRSTYISEQYGIKYPQWFQEKYAISTGGVIYSVNETKYPENVVLDTWKALKEINWFNDGTDRSFSIVIFHECGGITKVQMGKDYLTVADPTDWEIVEEIKEDEEHVSAQGHHSYCYDCTDLRKFKGTN